MKSVLVILSSLLLLGCTKAGITIANLPAKLSSHTIVKNQAYGEQNQQKLDIFIPEQIEGDITESRPVVVFFYGGRWTDGSKEMYAFIGQKLANQGYIAVIADYRKYPNVKFPTFVEDGAKAIAWTYRHISQYGGDPKQLFVSGHSSGAHIGALITADESYLGAENLSPNIISAFAGLAGPYDFVPKAPDLKDMFGPPENFKNMVVSHFIDGTEPPMLLMWGDEDEAVWRRNIDLLTEKILKKQGRVKRIIYPDVDHVGIISGLTWFLPKKAPVINDINAFFKQYKKPKSSA
ncbi:alpha/beta hydrolase [Catenovulum adriaticum]|uniref:Alpha/beta hydrolase fold domain-containing protein n=1 Tax=Catenovulum adriaticum TaxID=2984846 RepID=A0ABY7AMB9_9ALTE|nr:alpha/beta hydrolase [Catenovulum sp. TS8]WAJ70397.1 alpha/beta hydrolase fold domain-containing protein [Catenovulum sp. TS8]